MENFFRAVFGNPIKDWFAGNGPGGRRALDLGCGPSKVPGSFGLDCAAVPGVDLVYDLDVHPFPLPDHSFDAVYLMNTIEHFNSVCKTMDEVYRLLKPGGLLYIVTPHYTDAASWRDPQHKWHLNSYSFAYFDGSTCYSSARFSPVQNYVQLAAMWRPLLFELLINLQEKIWAFRFFRRTWELYFCYIVRAKKMYIVLRAEK